MGNYKLLNDLAISESGFLFQPVTGESFTLNSVGIFIMEGLKADKDSTEIINDIVNEYDTDQVAAEKDFQEFISQLKNHNLVREQ
jgi:hypothetical protein